MPDAAPHPLKRGPLRRWWVRAGIRSILAPFPGSSRLEERLRQRAATGLDRDYALVKWRHVTSHLNVARRAQRGKGATAAPSSGGDLDGARVVELGTGWYPLVPLGLALYGGTVLSIDKTPHLSPARAAASARILGELIDEDSITVPHTDRLETLHTLAALAPADDTSMTPADERRASAALAELGISIAVADAQDLATIPESHGADLYVSNNTLEHIPEPVLRGIFTEFARVGAPDSRMSHYIDMADHHAITDPRIGVYHFMTVPAWQWRLVNNRLHYQNRMRLSDHLRVFAETGWTPTPRKKQRGDADELASLDLVEPFASMSTEDLRVIRAHVEAHR